MSNSLTSFQSEKTKKQILCLIRPTDDVDTNIKQALEDVFEKAESNANASVFPSEVVSAIAFSLGNYYLMITSPDYHHRNCLPLRIL